jgi:putative methyltransferase (TIGR04325 family)
VRRTLKRFVPVSWRRRPKRPAIYSGDYPTWEEARRASRGYADIAILEQAVRAARAVRDGYAAWERDTVLFSIPAPNVPLLRALRAAAQTDAGRLNVLDFGGGLGSAWWQNESWLDDLKVERWSVIEQTGFVAAGRREFTVGPVRYYDSIDECCAHERPTVALLSSVLPYLENPRALLAEIGRRPFRHVIIDRTGFVPGGRDRLTVQHVPPSIYDASYPCWFFDRASLIQALGPDWRIIEEWTSDDDVDIDAEYRGMTLERVRP